jgi:hypothetical protein
LFRKELIDDFLTVVKAGPLEAVNGVGEVEETASGGHAENGECSRDPESLAAPGFRGAALVDQKQVGVKFRRKQNCRPFPVVEIGQRSIAGLRRWATSSQTGGLAIQSWTMGGALVRASSSRTTDGRMTFPNRIGSTPTCPIRIR